MSRRRRMRSLADDRKGISSVIGAIMVTGLVFSLILTLRVSFVPVWEKNAEAAYLVGVEKQLATIKSDLDQQVDNRTSIPLSNPLTLSRDRATIFQTSTAVHRLEFNTSGHAVRMDSNRLLIMSNNGTSIAGLNPAWQSVPPSGSITNVTRVESLRIRISPMDDGMVGQNVNLTVTDSNNDLVGYFLVTAYMSQNDYVISSATYQAPDDKLAEAGNAQDKQTSYDNYFIDALDSTLLFGNLIAAADGPVTLGLSHSGGIDADYTISYAQAVAGGGEVLVGTSGTLREPYVANYNAGSLRFLASSSHHVAQTYILENGALILEQSDGAVFRVPPSFGISRSGNIVAVATTLPSLTGSAASLTGVSNARITSSAFLNSDIQAVAPRLQMTVGTSFPGLWAAFWEEELEAASLSSSTVPPQYAITQTQNSITLSLFGVTADPASIAYDLTLAIKQARIVITVEA